MYIKGINVVLEGLNLNTISLMNESDGDCKIWSPYNNGDRYSPSSIGLFVYEGEHGLWLNDRLEFVSSSNCCNIISKKYGKLIVEELITPYYKPICIDFVKNRIIQIDQPRYYEYVGHFYSFDAAFYKVDGGLECGYDFKTGKQFPFMLNLLNDISSMFAWSICPVDNNIIVFSKSKNDNVLLYNVVQREVTEAITVDSLNNVCRITSVYDKNSCALYSECVTTTGERFTLKLDFYNPNI